MNSKIAIAYIPVLHKGYFDFLHDVATQGVTKLYVIGDDILESHDSLDYINRKDRLRALPIQTVLDSIATVTSLRVQELSLENIAEIQKNKSTIVTPREDIGEVVVQAYFSDHAVEYKDVFLRRNKLNITEDKVPDAATVTMTEFHQGVWQQVFTEAAKSTDWWRQVGAALVKDGEVIYVTHNEHMPEEQLPNIEGDTRALFKKGIKINYVTSAHAEVVAIGAAARNGIVTDGAELFTTDFPCPYCARLIAKAGIKTVYFMRGYAVLEGDEFLKGEGVKVIRVHE